LGKYLTVIIDPQGYNGQTRLSGGEMQKRQESIAKEVGKSHELVSAGDKFNKLLGEHQEEIEQWYLENHPTFRQAQSR